MEGFCLGIFTPVGILISTVIGYCCFVERSVADCIIISPNAVISKLSLVIHHYSTKPGRKPAGARRDLDQATLVKLRRIMLPIRWSLSDDGSARANPRQVISRLTQHPNIKVRNSAAERTVKSAMNGKDCAGGRRCEVITMDLNMPGQSDREIPPCNSADRERWVWSVDSDGMETESRHDRSDSIPFAEVFNCGPQNQPAVRALIAWLQLCGLKSYRRRRDQKLIEVPAAKCIGNDCRSPDATAGFIAK